LANAPNEMAALSRYSGLASMAGISLPSGGAEQQGTIILNTIVSRVFLKHLLSFEDILPSIMAVKSYDSESKKLVFNSNIYDAANKQWLQAKPSYIETYDVYRGLVEVIYDWSVGIISVTVEHKSPIFAKEFLDLIIRETDALIRQKDLQQSSDAIEYLVSELSKTSLIDMKNSINQMVRSQLETQMMAQISTDYVLKIIEPPFIPEKKSKPNRSFFVVLGTILGLVLGIVLILTRHYYVLNATEQASRP
jgi:capsule polysaccharide export protein KpsE/RkpR